MRHTTAVSRQARKRPSYPRQDDAAAGLLHRSPSSSLQPRGRRRSTHALPLPGCGSGAHVHKSVFCAPRTVTPSVISIVILPTTAHTWSPVQLRRHTHRSTRRAPLRRGRSRGRSARQASPTPTTPPPPSSTPTRSRHHSQIYTLIKPRLAPSLPSPIYPSVTTTADHDPCVLPATTTECALRQLIRTGRDHDGTLDKIQVSPAATSSPPTSLETDLKRGIVGRHPTISTEVVNASRAT